MPSLARLLASFGTADHVAAVLSRVLSTSPCLTDREQTMYGLTIAKQERAHERVSLAWACRHGWTPARGLTPHAVLTQRDALLLSHLPAPLRTAHILATVRVVEMQAAHGFRVLAETFERFDETREMAPDYRQIAREERLHVSTNRAIVRRLGEDPGFRRMERLAFQLARRVYNPLARGNVWAG